MPTQEIKLLSGFVLPGLFLFGFQVPCLSQTPLPRMVQQVPSTNQPEPSGAVMPRYSEVRQPATAAPTQTGAALGPVEEDYRLGAGDRLQMDVFNVAEYAGEYQVLADGTLSLPLIGTVNVNGMTVSQANSEISQRFSRYLRYPTVSLRLLAVRPLKIAVAGQINRPGTYTVPLNPETGYPTVSQVIQIAGGITQFADIRSIEVRRSNPQNGREPWTLDANLWELLMTGDLSQDRPLRDGDTIVIPTATTLASNEVPTLASASFSPTTITVNVVGEVAQPGVIEIPPNTPLNQALLAAGGFNRRAREGTVQLVRLNPDGTASRRSVEVDFAQGVGEENNPALRAGDTVIVATSGFSDLLDVVGSVISPVSGVLNILRLLR